MNLNIDWPALGKLYAALKNNDYAGSLAEFEQLVLEASTDSMSRTFWLMVGSLEPKHPLRQWFDRLSGHFADITYHPSHSLVWTGVVILRARLPTNEGKGRRVSEVVVEFEGTRDLRHIKVAAHYYVDRKQPPCREQYFSIESGKNFN